MQILFLQQTHPMLCTNTALVLSQQLTNLSTDSAALGDKLLIG